MTSPVSFTGAAVGQHGAKQGKWGGTTSFLGKRPWERGWGQKCHSKAFEKSLVCPISGMRIIQQKNPQRTKLNGTSG